MSSRTLNRSGSFRTWKAVYDGKHWIPVPVNEFIRSLTGEQIVHLSQLRNKIRDEEKATVLRVLRD